MKFSNMFGHAVRPDAVISVIVKQTDKHLWVVFVNLSDGRFVSENATTKTEADAMRDLIVKGVERATSKSTSSKL
jgi:hypothetical protein